MVSWQLSLSLFGPSLYTRTYTQCSLIREWSEFYPQHDTYTYLGVLGGSRYYDEEGNETQVRKDIVHKVNEVIRIAQEEWDAKAEERSKEYEEKRKKRAENKRKYEKRRKKQAAQAAANTK